MSGLFRQIETVRDDIGFAGGPEERPKLGQAARRSPKRQANGGAAATIIR